MFTSDVTYAVYTLFISFIICPFTCNSCILLFILCLLIVNVYSSAIVPSSLSTCIVTIVTSSTVLTFSIAWLTCFVPPFIPTFEVDTFVIALTLDKSISSVIVIS